MSAKKKCRFSNVFCLFLLSWGFKDLWVFPLFICCLSFFLSWLFCFALAILSFAFQKMELLLTFISFNKKTRHNYRSLELNGWWIFTTQFLPIKRITVFEKLWLNSVSQKNKVKCFPKKDHKLAKMFFSKEEYKYVLKLIFLPIFLKVITELRRN